MINEIEEHLRLLGKYRVDCVIVGGVAATIHGASQFTSDLDICYDREPANLARVVQALRSVNARLRGVPENLPFILDEETLQKGLNFTFSTDIGSLDLLGEVSGVGGFREAIEKAEVRDFFGNDFPILSLPKLIAAKRAAGRPKDLNTLPELEAIHQAILRKGS
jgi:hypothetical protein